jgi:hypothetical protein
VNCGVRLADNLPIVAHVRDVTGRLCLTLFAVTLVIVDDALCRG